MRPEYFTSFFIQSNQAFFALQSRPLPWIVDWFATRTHVVKHKHFAVSDGRASIATFDRRSPLYFEPLLRDRIDDARFVIDTITIAPHPLYPIFSRHLGA